MAIVTTDDSHYKAIADIVRENLPEDFAEVRFYPPEMPDMIVEACVHNNDIGWSVGFEDGMAEGFSEGYSTGHAEGFDEGKVEGITEGAEICAAKHFVHNFVGNGGTSYSFHVPFEPDMVYIFGFDPLAVNKAWALMEFVYDRRAFGIVGGFTQYGSGTGGVMNMAFTTTSALTRYSRTQDGTITIKNIGGTSDTIVYATGFIYTVVAVKYTEQTDKERITAFVNGLTGSGAATLNQAKVKAAFTDAEWAALIATKPSWTFNWI